VRVVVLTTSYPRTPEDVAGLFVRDAVEHLRAAGVEVEVVSPATFRHFGLAYGSGIVGNLKAAPWKLALVPAFLVAFAAAARRAARGGAGAGRADVVHAHWLVSALPALATGRPFVLQLWGTDVELARRAPWLARPLVRRARVVVCASRALADAASELGACEVRVIPSGIDLPPLPGPPEEPPHVLFVGRLSAEKGILELLAAVGALPLVVVGDGPLRDRVPTALGFIPNAELGPYYERAAVVCCPSLREGFGVACLEAMAHGRPVVASATGGLLDLVEDGVTGLLVQPGDTDALRAALERLLGDAGLRARWGAAGRERARARFSWQAATRGTLATYRQALAADPSARPSDTP
jgi:glycosyltransferase involved in cell wall biosynthesis